MTVPLQSPSSWKPNQWSSLLDADVRKACAIRCNRYLIRLLFKFTTPYHSSAILAAHVESATLPLRCDHVVTVQVVSCSRSHCLGCRLQRSDVDMRQFCDCVQGAENSRFAQMCGAIPAISSLDEKRFSRMVHDFSTPLPSYPVRQISLRV